MLSQHYDNSAGRMIFKTLSKSLQGECLVNTDIGIYDRLVQHNLKFSADASNITIPPYLFPCRFPRDLDSPPAILMLSWLPITMPNSILLLLSPAHTMCYAADTGPHRGPPQLIACHISVRQPHQLIAYQRHVHLIELKNYGDASTGQQLEVAQQQHADLCEFLSAGTRGSSEPMCLLFLN
eukprot:860004-Pelagomonas_calceolata.AAC.1